MVTNRDRKSFGSRRKNSKSCLDDRHRWRFWSVFRHFGTHFVESFHMSKSSWMMDPTWSREMSSCSAIGLTEIRRSFKISSWILSIVFEVVTVLCRLGRGATDVEKSPHLNWVTQCLTVAYNGVCYPIVFVRMARIFFGAFPWRKKIFTARFSLLLKWQASPDMLPFSLWNKKNLQLQHTNLPLFPPTLSIPSYDIGK